MKPITFCILLLSLITLNISAQKFDAYATAGGVVSQIDGDRLGGYNKAGVKVGMGVERQITEKWDMCLEIGYIQNGKGTFNESSNASYKTTLHYLQLPILLQYNAAEKWNLELGLAPAYLISYKFYENGGETKAPYTPYSFDVTTLLGANYILDQTWSINLRFAHSLLPMGDTTPEDVEVPNRWKNPYSKFNRSIALSLVYKI